MDRFSIRIMVFLSPASALFMGGGGTLLHLAQDEAGGNINFRNFRNMQHVPILNTATAVIGH